MLLGMRPIRDPSYLILTALAAGPRHGHGVIEGMRELSGGPVTLLAGTRYQALDRLTDAGLAALDREDRVDGRSRRYYRLTDAGGAALADRTARSHRATRAWPARLPAALPRPLPALS